MPQEWKNIRHQRFFFRSTWEFRYALYLDYLEQSSAIEKWQFEPTTFWFLEIKRGVRSYLPDFKITNIDGTHEWHEVKGYMDARSKTKIKRFNKYYPKEKLVIIDKKWFTKNWPKLKFLEANHDVL